MSVFVRLSPLVFTVALGLSGCASSIDRSDEIRTQRLEIGRATKDDVVRAIGLPRQITAGPTTGLERWFYVAQADSSSVLVPLVTTVRTRIATVAVLPFDTTSPPQGATLVAVFDKSAHLVDVQRIQPSNPHDAH